MRIWICLAALLSFHCLAVTLQGEVTQGALIRGVAEANAQVWLDKQSLKVGPAGEFAFGIGRDETGDKQLKIITANGSESIQTLTIKPREFHIQRVEGIAKRIMQPNPEDVARAQKDNQMVREARSISSDRLDFTEDFIWPLTGPITGVYGSQRYYNGEPRSPHYGIDIAQPTGTKVVAPADGKVLLWVPDMFYSGGTMIIDHGFGVSSTFLHLSGSLVKVGDEVKQGQAVALVGATGRVTGAHLDWRINWNSVRLDAQLVVPPMSQVLATEKAAK